MKQLKKSGIVLAALMILLIPAASYAIVDFSAYGGYSFAGDIDDGNNKGDIDGWQYGFYGHLNTGIPMLFTVGLGGFYQIAPHKYDTGNSDWGEIDVTKNTYGLDAYVQLDLPFLPVYPYVRAGLAIKEKIEIDSDFGSQTYSENFKSSYYGVGASYSVFDAIVWDLQLFVEYLYYTSKQEKDIKITGNSINAGLKISL
jgi:hypothetical protein